MSKLKALAADNSDVAQMEQFFFDKVKNIVGQGENAGSLFQQCFQNPSFIDSLIICKLQ